MSDQELSELLSHPRVRSWVERVATQAAEAAYAAMSARADEARKIFEGIAPQFTAEKVAESTVALGEFIKILVFELVQSEGSDIGTKGAMELARALLAVIQGQKISADRRAKLEADVKSKLVKAAEGAVATVAATGKAVDAEAVLRKIREEVYGIQAAP